MVKAKESSYLLADGTIDIESWLEHLTKKYTAQQVQIIRNACLLSQLAGEERMIFTGQSCYQQGLLMADTLVDLGLDHETIAAAIVYDSIEYADLNYTDIEEHLGKSIAKLVQGTEHMDAIQSLSLSGRVEEKNRLQFDNIRRMLLAMVEDVRVVLIKLAERVCLLRIADHLSETLQIKFGHETLEIYAPLASRLGIGSLKWEMEDLAFRCLQPEKYKELAKRIHERRIDRERFIQNIIIELKKNLQTAGLTHFEVAGRAKHIYSINRKMQRKNVKFEQIFDIHAIRILVDEIENCYQALSVVHTHWHHIQQEFDDYIATPKPNGYRSIHTAVETADGHIFEVQIRTYKMHKESELGVAAHWIYKEGPQNYSGYETKIAWLRQVLEWQKELVDSGEVVDEISTKIFNDRVYAFTPAGKIIDLPTGSTPIDFAYHIHSDIGHRCRGAKVDGKIVTLKYHLKTGDRVEILTVKIGGPSRDWLNFNLGYIKSSRAKAKILHWFKEQDHEKNAPDNREDRTPHKTIIIDKKSDTEVFTYKPKTSSAPSEHLSENTHVQGMRHLLTHQASCCKAIPGDQIIGYITLGRGISIHRSDCPNITHADANRLIDVSWENESTQSKHYPVDIHIRAYDRPGLFKDIATLLANEKINVAGVQSKIFRLENIADIHITIDIVHLGDLVKIIERLKQLPNIMSVRRKQ